MNAVATAPRAATEVLTPATPGSVPTTPTDGFSDKTTSSQQPDTTVCPQSDTPNKNATVTTAPPITESPPTPSQEVTSRLLLKTVSDPITASESAKMGHKTRKGILYVTSFFVPPLAVYLRRGTNADFGLNILLTLLGRIPGVLHAMYLVSK
ncbi:hypothetical protein L209DRAFT_750489 [Thermothelomyces heterothallicus CBS 203.75]